MTEHDVWIRWLARYLAFEAVGLPPQADGLAEARAAHRRLDSPDKPVRGFRPCRWRCVVKPRA